MNKNRPKYSLLYVEDDDFIRHSAVEFLEDLFLKIYEASCAKEAIYIYEKHKPDIIITDINMPHMNGLEFCRYIRKSDKNTPIIVTTAYTDTEYLLQAVELTLIKYLLKPIEEEKLLEALNICFEQLNTLYQHKFKLTPQLSFDTFSDTLFKKDEIIKLTNHEIKFLKLLLKHRHRVVTYTEIENYIYYDKGMSEDALKSLVKSLRKKTSSILIQNHSKIGYKINPYD